MSCANKHALVTGASSGIGRATALALSSRDWHVFATVRHDLDSDALERAAAGHLTPLLMDVMQVVEAAVVRAIETRRHRARYLVGKDARPLAMLAPLPPGVLDGLLRRFFGLPQPGSKARPVRS